MGTSGTYRRVLTNPRLGRLMIGEFVSSVGDWLYLVALLIVVYDISKDPVLLGIVGAARIVPFLVLAVPAGIAADRFDRRMILLVTDIIRGVLQVVLAALVISGAATVWIVAVAILAACASSFFGPAIGAYLPSLVDDEADLGAANSVWATLDNLAFFIGPAIAGVLIAAGGLAIAFLLNAVTFAFVAFVLATLPSRGTPVQATPAAPSSDPVAPAPGDAGMSPAADGPTADSPAADRSPQPVTASTWASIARRIPGLVILDAGTSFVGGGLAVLTVVVADTVLDAGTEMTGYLNAATGIGGIIAGVVAGWLVLRRLEGPIVGSAIAALATLALVALTGNVLLSLVAIGIAAGALLALDVFNATVLQRLVPDEERGRAMGLLQVSSSIAMIAGSFVAPVVAAWWGAGTALIASGALAVITSIAAVLVIRPSGALTPPTYTDRRLERLQASPFGSLPASRLEAAARALEPLAVTARTRVIAQDEEADRFYFIDRGAFLVTQRSASGEEVELRTLGPGDVFGEIGILTVAPRTASVTATTDGELFALDRDAFLELVSAGPGLSSRLLDLHRGAPGLGAARS